MCAINGIYAYNSAAGAVDASELVRTRDQMAARGPDAKGAWISEDGTIGFGHRRLSIIDLSERGAQPMASADGALVVTFNGEIYNYKALRRDLEAKGHVFRSHSDTEVLLHLYAEKGEDMVHDLRGMFAFGLWDANKRALLLVRDPFGIKPLYVADDGASLRFASQVKALISGGGVSHERDPAGWAGFYLLGCVPEPFTTFRAIKALPRGSYMWVDRSGAREPKRYFSAAGIYCEAERAQGDLPAEDAQRHARQALLDSVRHHLVADVPVGAFLSAGVDSGSLVGLMRDAGQGDIQTVTLAFDEYRGRASDEAPQAEELAAQYGTRHTTRRIGESEFHDDLPRIMAAMDQPTVDGINTWFVSKAATELGLKVAISGLGGDELFGGYSSFRDIPRLIRWMALPSRVPFLGDGMLHVMSALARVAPQVRPKSAGIVKYGGDCSSAFLLRRGLFLPWELASVMPAEEAREGLRRLRLHELIGKALAPEPATTFGKIASLESALYMGNQLLRDTDWASMAHSLEVRVPLVDSELIRRIAPIMVRGQGHGGKELLALSPTRPLPESIIKRPKTGFAMPFEEWIARSSRFEVSRNAPHRSKARVPWARLWASEIARAMA